MLMPQKFYTSLDCTKNIYQYNNFFDLFNKRFGYANTPHYLFGHKGYPLIYQPNHDNM